MSLTNLALTILGATATSTGIGIAVVNLTTTNNENIEKKIKKLWEEISVNIVLLTSKVGEIIKNQDSIEFKKYMNILKEISNIATTINNTYTLNPYKNSQETYKQLQQIQKEMDEVLELLKKPKTNSI